MKLVGVNGFIFVFINRHVLRYISIHTYFTVIDTNLLYSALLDVSVCTTIPRHCPLFEISLVVETETCSIVKYNRLRVIYIYIYIYIQGVSRL